MPDVPGAYLPLIDLPRPASLPSRIAATLPPGLYVYAGSAHGPSGIRARAGRHLRRDKPKRWHVDWPTEIAACTALPLTDASECVAVGALAAHYVFTTPVAAFGGSDCRTCAAHLLRWTGNGASSAVKRAILRALASDDRSAPLSGT